MDVSVEAPGGAVLVEFEQQRLPMSLDDYLVFAEQPDQPKAEYVDGTVIVSPASFDHGRRQTDLAVCLKMALADLIVVTEVYYRLGERLIRVPDISVVDHMPAGTMIEDAPVLVVEVLSPSTRGEDMLNKSGEYLAGGVGQYWLLDREQRQLDVYANSGTAWVPFVHFDEANPTGEVKVGDHGVVQIDLGQLLR